MTATAAAAISPQQAKGVTANILLIAIATILVSVSLGINSIIIPASLNAMGYSEAFIGGILAFETLAAIVIALALSGMLQKGDPKWLLLWSTLLRVLPLFVFVLTDDMITWALVIFIHGLALAVFYIVTQTWVNALPISENRGLISGIYNTAYAIGLALGPVTIQFKEEIEVIIVENFGRISDLLITQSDSILVSTEGMEGALILSILLSTLGTLPLLFLRKNFPPCEKEHRSSITDVIKKEPESLLAVAISGVSSGGVLAFIVIYGQKNALSLDQAALLLTCFIMGSLTLQTGFSWLSDKYYRRNILVLAAFISMCCAAALPMSIPYYTPALFLIFIWGGAVGGIYSITLAMIGDKFAGKDVSTANAGYELMDNAGGVLGVIIIGASMAAIGSDGLPYVIMFASIVYFSFVLTRFRVI